MRRKRARLILSILIAVSTGMALFGPRLPRLQATLGATLAPVSYPVYRSAGAVADAFEPPGPIDPVSPAQPRELAHVALENEQLRQQVMWLRSQLDQLRRIHADRARLGTSLLERSVPARVTGSEGSTLQVVTASIGELEAEMPVLHFGSVHVGVAGVISAVGPASAQVRLISDPAVRFEGRFVRVVPGADMEASDRELPTDPPLIEGAGNGLCQVSRMDQAKLEEAGVKAGDWVVAEEPAWDEQLRGVRVGQVERIEPIADQPGFARVLIRPAVDLTRLREVMIVK